MNDFGLTPKPYRLPKDTQTAILVDYYRGNPHFLFHYHPEYELVMTRSNGGKRIIGDTISEYLCHDFVLLGPNVPHTWVSEHLTETVAEKDNIVVHFSRESLGLDFLSKSELTAVNQLLDKSCRGLFFGTDMVRQAEPYMKKIAFTHGLEQFINFLSVLNLLTESSIQQEIVSPEYDCSLIDSDSENFARVLEYIYQHNEQTIRLDSIAAHLYMSTPTFTRFFRRMTGKSFIAYLNEWRIRHSCVLLHETDWSVLEISLKSGFSNLSHFNHQFNKLIKMTPREYRKSVKGCKSNENILDEH